jgi:hypothetical protein
MGCCNLEEYSSSLDSQDIDIFNHKLAAVALTEKKDSEVCNQYSARKNKNIGRFKV